MRKIILTALAIALPTIAVADAVTDAVKARQDEMKARGQQVGILAAMAKGETEYDAAAAQAAADALLVLVSKDTSALWVPGSTSDDLPGVSRAKPELWDNFAKAGEIGTKGVETATALVAVAGNGQAEMAQALGGVGQTCSECHKAFQAPKN